MNKLSVKVQVLDHWHLVQQTVGHCSPGQTSGGGLVGDHGQENVQVILEELKVPRVFVSKSFGYKVEEVGTMNPKRLFSCLFHLTRSIAGYPVRNG